MKFLIIGGDTRNLELAKILTQSGHTVQTMALGDNKDKEIVYDGFGGSGSTLIACEQLGRKCYMMELDPHYIDVIIQRWENFTGKKAIKL